jgi:hypothetical protein
MAQELVGKLLRRLPRKGLHLLGTPGHEQRPAEPRPFCGISAAAAGVTRLAGWARRIRTFVWLNQCGPEDGVFQKCGWRLAPARPSTLTALFKVGSTYARLPSVSKKCLKLG